MQPTLEVRQLAAADWPDWNAAVAKAEEGSNYQTAEYLKALAEATGAAWRLRGVYADGQLVGGLGTYEVRSWPGVSAVSRLLLYYHGPFVVPCLSQQPSRQERHRRHVLATLESSLRAADYHQIRLKTRQPNLDYRAFLSQGWAARPIYTYVADLRNLNELWRRVDNNLRRLVRRCEQEKMQFVEEGDFANFWEQHEDVHRRKGAPVYLPQSAFQAFYEQLREQQILRVLEARSADGTSLATQLVLLGPHPVSHTIAAAARGDQQQGGANAFLRWRSFEWLARRGYLANDLTDAHEPTVARFKAQLGTELQIGLQLELLPSTAGAALDKLHELAVRATNKLKRLTRAGGER